jgi:phenylacetate-CoA ligase
MNQPDNLENLFASVNQAYKDISFYNSCQKSGKKVRSLADFEKLPIVSKINFEGKPATSITRANQKKGGISFATTGTTRQRLFIHLEKADFLEWLVPKAKDALVNFVGLKKGEEVISTFGWGLTQPGCEYALGAIQAGAHVYPVGPGILTPSKETVKIMAKKNGSTIFATPSYALRLSEVAIENELTPSSFGIRRFLVTGEMLTNAARKRIEEAWKTEVFNVYGMAETGLAGAECKNHSALHLLSNYLYPETTPAQILNSESKDAKELVLTTIGKRGMPFVRYNTSDLVTLSNKPCSCGFCGTSITKYFGRSDGMLKIKGRSIYPAHIEEILLSMPEVSSQYQIRIEHGEFFDTLSVAAELKQGIPNRRKMAERISERIKEELGIKLDVKLCKKDSLPQCEGWKEKRIVEIDVRKNTSN